MNHRSTTNESGPAAAASSAKPTLAIVSPIKNELPNLPALLESVQRQTRPVSLWVLVDDQSDDGSSEYLRANATKLDNVTKVVLVRTEGLPSGYELGAKYARVVDRGFKAVREHEQPLGSRYDYIGILDADCFVAPDYYEKLLEKFSLLPRLGIASGYLYYKIGERLKLARTPRRWPRGGIRVWRRQCLEEAGYFVTKSADAVSSASAWLKGWHNQAFPDARGETRDVGIRADPLYYGRSSYERYVPHYYVLFKSLFCAFKNLNSARNYYRGYRQAEREGRRAPISQEVQTYFKLLPFHYCKECVVVLANRLRLSQHRGQ